MTDKLVMLSHLGLFRQAFAYKEDSSQNITASGIVVSTVRANQIENGDFIDFHKVLFLCVLKGIYAQKPYRRLHITNISFFFVYKKL